MSTLQRADVRQPNAWTPNTCVGFNRPFAMGKCSAQRLRGCANQSPNPANTRAILAHDLLRIGIMASQFLTNTLGDGPGAMFSAPLASRRWP